MPTRKLHSEQTALAALQARQPERFLHAYLADRPDIQAPLADVGVEVTDGVRADLRQVLAHAHTPHHQALARMGIAASYRAKMPLISQKHALNDVEAAIRRKTAKFAGYRKFGENDLFIHVMPDALRAVQAVITTCKQLAAVPFDRIYLFDGRQLIAIQMDNWQVSRY